MINIILDCSSNGRAYVSAWTNWGYDIEDVYAHVERKIMNALEKIERCDAGDDNTLSYEQCYQNFEKVLKDFFEEGAGYITHFA